jgi:hypothetical protein
MSIYRGYFTKVEDIISNFYIKAEELQGVEILFAEYDCPWYEGYAWVVFRKEDQLYEVNGSHCSCYGLEDQWKPELTSAKAILMRPRAKEEVDPELWNLLQSMIG